MEPRGGQSHHVSKGRQSTKNHLGGERLKTQVGKKNALSPMIGTQSMAGQVMKTLDLGKPSKNEKKMKKTNLCPHGRDQRHPSSTRLPQEARPPASVRCSPHCRATGAHLDTETVVKAVASISVKKTDSDAFRVMFVFRNQTAPPAIPDVCRVAAKAPGGAHIWAPPAEAKVGKRKEKKVALLA